MKKENLNHLIKKEKLQYLEVEQLRYSLYLHNSSILFQFLAAFYFTYHDAISLFKFNKNKSKDVSLLKQKKQFLVSLETKRTYLLFLQKTPYVWIIMIIRFVYRSLVSIQFKLYKMKRNFQKKTYVIFGSTNCFDMQSRSVQIAKKLALHSEVIYIEGDFDEGSKPGYRIIEQSKTFTSIRLKVNKIFHLNYQVPSKKDVSILRLSYMQVIKHLNLVDYTSYVHHSFWGLVFDFKPKSFYFDRASDVIHEHTTARHVVVMEKKLLKKALRITAPDPTLVRSHKDIVIENGVDWEIFKKSSKMIQTCDVGLCWIKKPVMGYIGALDERIDVQLLARIASSFPTASIVLVGNTDYRPVIEIAEKFPNVYPVGEQPYKKLLLFLQSFDILITPFIYNKNALMSHPELPLYLISGKPIIATYSSSNKGGGKYMYMAKSQTEWNYLITDALKEKPRCKKKYLRISLAKKLVWKSPKFS